MSQPFSLETLAEYGPIYGPAGDAPAPGIIILHGAEGPMAGWAHRYALILAAQGFLALPYAYGEGDFLARGRLLTCRYHACAMRYPRLTITRVALEWVCLAGRAVLKRRYCLRR